MLVGTLFVLLLAVPLQDQRKLAPTAESPTAGRATPAGLTAQDWSRIRNAIRESRYEASRVAQPMASVFVHDARLLGHGEGFGLPVEEEGISVSVSGDTAVVGAGHAIGTSGPTAAFVFVRSGAVWTEQQRLLGDGAFGRAVSISGDTLVVGAPFDVNGGSAHVFVRSGTSWTEQQQLRGSDTTNPDMLGSSVSISGDTVVLGAPYADTAAGEDAGAAYVFARVGTTWTEQLKLTPLEAAPGDQFGSSVSVSLDTVIAGAPGHDLASGVDAGAAYAFVYSGATWTEQQQLVASDGTTGDTLGRSVSVSGDTAVVGAPGAIGRAYVFVRSGQTWGEQQKLAAGAGDMFGYAVSVDGDTAVVGAPRRNNYIGSEYVFVRSGTTWSQQQELVASNGHGGDQLGWSVAVSGDTTVAGAPWYAGRSFAFARSGTTWTLEQPLQPPDMGENDRFGWSVAVSGDTVAVGAPQDASLAGGQAGSVYVFVRSGLLWNEQQKLAPAPEGALFGYSVALSGDTLVVGAPTNGASIPLLEGAAYVFVRSGTTWTGQQQLHAQLGFESYIFGRSVAVSGDTAVVGDPGTYVSAYVFLRTGSTWNQQQRLTPFDTGTGFGRAVSISGDTTIVGAPLDNTAAGFQAGSAYVFLRSGTTWNTPQKLTAPDGSGDDQFGSSLWVSGDTAAIGMPGDDTTVGVDAGSIYVLVRSGTTWSQQQKLSPPDGATKERAGYSVSLSTSGDTLVAGAPGADPPLPSDAGSAYVFVRSGSVWSEQQKLSVADGVLGDQFGHSVSIDGDTLAIGIALDDTPNGFDAGSVEILQRLTATDIGVSKTDGQSSAVPGLPVTYTMTITDAGPDPGIGARVVDTPPAALTNVSWTCSASPGSSCPASGAGAIDHTVNVFVNGTLTYALTGTVSPSATGTLSNTVTVAPLTGITDPNPANNSATDTDTLAPEADLAVTKTDGQTAAVPGQPIAYTITVTNSGPSVATSATVTDTVPAAIQGATWTCSASAGSTCTASGTGSISDTMTGLVGGTLTYTLTGTVDPGATVALVNTATVAPGPGTSDPAMANNSATDTDALPVGFATTGELIHGYDREHDLAALPGPVAAEDLFRIFQNGHASYEVLVEGVTGDLGAAGPLLDRLASDASTVLQPSVPAGVAGSRSLRWMNALDQPVADEFVRIRSAGCTTDCDPADVYHLGARETTGFIPRFNNSGTQVTVLVLQNIGDQPMDMDVRLWSQSGAVLGGPPTITLGPRQTYVLNTSTIAPAVSGSITVGNTGRYGQLAGKAVAVEPATGFTFDTTLEPRAR